MAKSRILERLERGDRYWLAEIVVRAVGLTLLSICAAAALWLWRSVHAGPQHEPGYIEMADAALVFLSWSLGGSFLTIGPGLFRLVEVPARYVRFATTKGPSS